MRTRSCYHGESAQSGEEELEFGVRCRLQPGGLYQMMSDCLELPLSLYCRSTQVELTRFRGRLTYPSFGEEVSHDEEQEGRSSSDVA